MPIYEYVCESCGKLIERIEIGLKWRQALGPEPFRCPECGNYTMVRMMSVPAISKLATPFF